MKVLLAAPAVGEAPDTRLAEDGSERPVVSNLDAGPWSPRGVDNIFDAYFALCPQIEVVLEQPEKQLPARYFEVCFERTVVQSECLFAVQEVNDRLEVLARQGEAVIAREHN
jgi:hypothetical protein